MHGLAEEAVADLPPGTQAWFEEFSTSPIEEIFQSRKDELWLHLSLLESLRDKLAITRLRLLPMNKPMPVDAIHVPESELTWRRRAVRSVRYWMHIATRLRHHARALPAAAQSGWKWYRRLSVSAGGQ
jgi:hypothetical protein